MSKIQEVELLLKSYKLNKARVVFLENQIERLTPESHEDYIEYRMYDGGYSGATPKFILENGREVAELNKVEATACEYRKKCEKEYKEARKEIEKEIKVLRYNASIVEDIMEILTRVNQKYRIVAESYYINNVAIADIADFMHISKSRCYELCKESVGYIAKVVFGDKAVV